MNDGSNAISIHRLDNYMHMVWHDAPCQKTVASGIKVHDGIFDHLSDSGLREPARSHAVIERECQPL